MTTLYCSISGLSEEQRSEGVNEIVPLPFDKKVLGLGLGRTGTNSLCMALNHLGIKTKHFLDSPTRREILSGISHFNILERYQGIANGTASPYRRLDRVFPGSRFILTVRENKNAWIESKRRYAALELENWPIFDPQRRASKKFLREYVYGSFEFDEDLWLKAYEQHVLGVLNYFKNRAENLLVIDITKGDGWDKLCPFLGAPLPSIPFPHLNSYQAASNWSRNVATVWSDIERLIPSNCKFILVDDCELGASNRNALPFLEFNGRYWGRPANDPQAVDELDRMRRAGADFIVFVWATFWWLEHYAEFNQYLRSKFRCVVENDSLVIFDLRSSITSATA